MYTSQKQSPVLLLFEKKRVSLFHKNSNRCLFMNIVEQQTAALNKLCETHQVKELYLFGSVLTNKFNESSDIDMLIKFNAIDIAEYFDNYMDLKESFEKLFNRNVDLVESQAINNPIFRKVVDREKVLIYGRADS